MQQCIYEAKICDMDYLQKRLMQTRFDFEESSRLPQTSGVTMWDHVCMLVVETLNTCCEIIVHVYYVVYQSILWNCYCNVVYLTAILQLTLTAEFVFTCIFGVSDLTT